MGDEFDTLLGVGMGEDIEEENPSPPAAPKLADNIKGEIDKMRADAADLREQIRQLSEENKEYKDFKQRLFGDPKSEEERKRVLKAEQEYLEDPVKYMDARLQNLEKKIDTREVKKNVDVALREVQRDYDVDFDQHYPKIVDELKQFSEEAKAKDPKGCLLKACRLAGVLKLKKKEVSNPITGEGRRKASLIKEKTEQDKIKERILGKPRKKSTNIFNI